MSSSKVAAPTAAADLERLQQALQVRMQDPDLLDQALTHRSCGRHNNERLEFLGDSILNHIIADYLYHHFPDASEGDLSRMRAALVKGDTLAGVARSLELGSWVKLGPGELKSGGSRRESILADTLEAILGAICLDAGPGAARDRVLAWYGERLLEVSPETATKDAKTSLQEYLQGRGLSRPGYALTQIEGADHCQQFEVECRVADLGVSARGQGSSRRRAEQAAAAAVLEALRD